MSTPKAEPRRLRALIVEDDPHFRQVVHGYLEMMDIDAEQIAEGNAAMKRLREMTPDLVLLDLMLPELSGYAICEFMRSSPAHRNVPILIISARNQPSDHAHAEEAGASAYLAKPFSFRELKAEVAQLMAPKKSPRGRTAKP